MDVAQVLPSVCQVFLLLACTEFGDAFIHLAFNTLGKAWIRFIVESGLQYLKQDEEGCHEKGLDYVVEQSRGTFLKHSVANELRGPADTLRD